MGRSLFGYERNRYDHFCSHKRVQLFENHSYISTGYLQVSLSHEKIENLHLTFVLYVYFAPAGRCMRNLLRRRWLLASRRFDTRPRRWCWHLVIRIRKINASAPSMRVYIYFYLYLKCQICIQRLALSVHFRNWSSVHDGCSLNGVQNLEPCQNAPVIVSFPHFYLADQVLRDYVAEGLNPKKGNHETFVEIEPVW